MVGFERFWTWRVGTFRRRGSHNRRRAGRPSNSARSRSGIRPRDKPQASGGSRKKIIARELAIKIGALAEITEIILRERSHERVLAIVEARVGVVICEVDPGMAVDDIHNYGDAVLVGDVHHLLEGGSLPESFVDAKIADGKIAPVN